MAPVSSDRTAAGDRVGVVIVNYNGGDVILRALSQLRAQTMPPARVIVVDNASTDGSAARIAEEHPWVELVEARLEHRIRRRQQHRHARC